MDKIITDHKILKQVSKPTTMEEVEKLNLVIRLKMAVKSAWTPGYGLAAIQIGVPLRFAWFEWGGQEYILLNPTKLIGIGRPKLKKEGCLSIPQRWGFTRRYNKITYESEGTIFRAKAQKAHIVQHEMDHMDGLLNIYRKEWIDD
jgi:peptide deformylase